MKSKFSCGTYFFVTLEEIKDDEKGLNFFLLILIVWKILGKFRELQVEKMLNKLFAFFCDFFQFFRPLSCNSLIFGILIKERELIMRKKYIFYQFHCFHVNNCITKKNQKLFHKDMKKHIIKLTKYQNSS